MDHHSSEDDDEEEGGQGLPKSEVSSTRVSSSPVDAIPPPPNRGLVCFVLRTGFDTVQGQLLRTMAYHAEAGGGGGGNGGGGDGVNAMETLYFLLILLLCALGSAATVVDHAWGDVTRNRFKLVLHVVIIITSVIPPELPSELYASM
jgi:cation-transporting ATPase 13A1